MTMFSTKSAPAAKDSVFTLIPQGVYEATCEFADLIHTKAGDMMFKFTYQITEDTGFFNRKIFDNIMWTFEPKDGSPEASEKAAYTLEQAHGKLADALFSIDCEGFNSEEPGEVLDIMLGRDFKIKIGQREDKQRGEKVNTADTFYTLAGKHRTRADAPRSTVRKAPPAPSRQPAPRQAPAPSQANQVSPQEILDRQHRSQAPAVSDPSRQTPWQSPPPPTRQSQTPRQPQHREVAPQNYREDTPF